MKDIGILVHGRHLQTNEWELVEWGNPPYQLGVLPRLVLEVLVRGPERIRGVVFGTGASERDGFTEAEYTQRFLLERFDELTDFASLTPYTQAVPRARALIAEAVIDNESMNTREEITSAARLFREWECEEVYQITGGSHAPRATLDMLKTKHSGLIPAGQRWYPVADDMIYSGTDINDVVVIEPPHRGDDAMLGASIQMHAVIPKMYKLSAEDRVIVLRELEQLINDRQKT